jgi:hypothetical protein
MYASSERPARDRPPRTSGSGAPLPKQSAVVSRGSRSRKSKRSSKNFEGAFPLLLIGSALLVYCAILRNQSVSASGAHFPLWALIGTVGAVIAGAGVYSVFLNPSAPAARVVPEGFVLVPEAECEASRPGRRVDGRSTPPMLDPPWWEGPEVYPEPSRERPTRAAIPRVADRSVPPPRMAPRGQPAPPPARRAPAGGMGPAPRPPPRAVPTRGPEPLAPRRASLSELNETLAELEALADSEFKPSPRRMPKTVPTEPHSCADCGRGLPSGPSEERCSGCNRTLCVDCALSSQFEDADLRCNECRAREPKGEPAARSGASRR